MPMCACRATATSREGAFCDRDSRHTSPRACVASHPMDAPAPPGGAPRTRTLDVAVAAAEQVDFGALLLPDPILKGIRYGHNRVPRETVRWCGARTNYHAQRYGLDNTEPCAAQVDSHRPLRLRFAFHAAPNTSFNLISVFLTLPLVISASKPQLTQIRPCCAGQVWHRQDRRLRYHSTQSY